MTTPRPVRGQLDLPLMPSPVALTTAILRRRSAPGWQQRALCAGGDPETWFPDASDAEGIDRAKATCRVCPVARCCLAAALVDAEQGVWGQTSDVDRHFARADLCAGVPVDQVLDHYTTPAEWSESA